MSVGVRASEGIEDRQSSKDQIEELVVEGYQWELTDLNLEEVEAIYEEKHIASRHFKLGRYKDAFPYLLRLAKLGMKDSQARVAYIYLHGLGGVPKSNVLGLAWLGTAATPHTRPQYRTILKSMLAEVPEAQKQMVHNKIQEYREKYDSDVRGVECYHSGIQRAMSFTCRIKDEYWRRYMIDPVEFDVSN